jgi:hypothetical protein
MREHRGVLLIASQNRKTILAIAEQPHEVKVLV